MLKGLLASGITLGAAAVFPEAFVFPFFTVVLGFASGVFPGFAMAESRGGYPKVEWVVALGVVAMGLAGLCFSPGLLVVAWVIHGLWSLLHHYTALGDGMPEGYPRVCLTYDLVMAGFIAYVWTLSP